MHYQCVPPDNITLTLLEPSIIFELPDIVLTTISRFTKKEKYFLSLKIVLVALLARHISPLLRLMLILILSKK